MIYKTLALVSVCFVLAGVFVLAMNNRTQVNQPDQETSLTSSTSSVGSVISPQTNATTRGDYLDYSEEALSTKIGNKRVLFFYANWCPSCRQQDAALKSATDQIPEGITIFKLNYDSEIALRQKHGVTTQHTFVQIDSNGDSLKKWNSLYNNNDVQSIVDMLI